MAWPFSRRGARRSYGPGDCDHIHMLQDWTARAAARRGRLENLAQAARAAFRPSIISGRAATVSHLRPEALLCRTNGVRALRAERSICSELADTLTAAPQRNRCAGSSLPRELGKQQRIVRRCKDDMDRQSGIRYSDLDDDDMADLERRLAELRQQKRQAEDAARAADQEVHAALIALASEQRHWPEVTKSLAKLGLPAELLPLWRPGRDTSYYDKYVVLEGALARPGNRIMRAVRGGVVTVVKEYQQNSAQALRTCLREARLLHRMRHPGIVEICSIFKLDGRGGATVFCLEMPLYAHGQLDAFVRRESPTVGAVKQLFMQVVRALAHLHAHGVVHRDIKPGNI